MPPVLRLKRGEDRRLRAGHLWVFSNEVDVAHTPLTGFEPGEAVQVQDSRGLPVGSGYVNPHSLICARLVSREPDRPLDAGLLRERIGRALALRERLYGGDGPFYRLVFGESDRLPGLVVDRYGDALVAQITTAGMERVKADVVEALREAIGARTIVLRNDTPARTLEGLGLYVETLGEPAERLEVRENGVRFEVPLAEGQKTGWFYDHRENRARLRRYVAGRSVLDVFSYIGGWGVQAAAAGAAKVVCVDSSAAALEHLGHSARLNGVQERVRTLQADAFDALRDLRAAGERFDVIVLDPPAFIKRKKDAKQGETAYQRINHLALDVLAPDGILVSASCSHHLSRDTLLELIQRAAREARREVQVLEEGHQAADHPLHPAIPETGYLKAFFVRAY